MKKLSKTILDKPIFIDTEGKMPFRQPPDPSLIQTPRIYLLNAFNLPVPGADGRGVPLTRERLKKFDALEIALKEEDALLDDSEIGFLKAFIDELQVTIRGVRRALDEMIDSAQTWKPEPKPTA